MQHVWESVRNLVNIEDLDVLGGLNYNGLRNGGGVCIPPAAGGRKRGVWIFNCN